MNGQNVFLNCQAKLHLVFFVVFFPVAGCGLQSEQTLAEVKIQEVPNCNSSPQLMTNSQVEAQASESFKPSSGSDPVSVRLQASRDSINPGDRFDVFITLDIYPMYEIHELESLPPSVPTELDLVLPAEFQSNGEWILPERVASSRPNGDRVYVRRSTFRKQISIDPQAQKGRYEIESHIQYQACNTHHCMRPQSVTLRIPISVFPVSENDPR